NEALVAVYDLGGGTFDISILKLRDGIFEVLATNGDTHLGGDDIDNALISTLLREIQESSGRSFQNDPGIFQDVRKAAIEAKHTVSDHDRGSVSINLETAGGALEKAGGTTTGQAFRREITREEFESIAGDLVERTVGPCKQALKDAGLAPEQIDEVVM